MAAKNSKLDLNLDVDAYSLTDLYKLLNLPADGEATVFQIKDSANQWVAKLKRDKKPAMAKFFLAVGDRLVTAALENPYGQLDKKDGGDMDSAFEEGLVNNFLDKDDTGIEDIWLKKQLPVKDGKTDASGKAYLFDDGTHFVAKDRSDGDAVAATPAGHILMTRLVSVDSQFRATILPYSSNALAPSFNTSFQFNLANPVNNAVGFRLYAYTIPTTWYAFSAPQGNTFFQYNGVVLSVPDGNYTVATLLTTINALAAQDIATAGLILSGPDPQTGKITLTNNDPYSENVTVVFYVQQGTTNLYACGQSLAQLFQTVGINNTLGWLLGFRTTPDPVTGDVVLTVAKGASVVADVPPDVYGPKYMTLAIEDFNYQRLTSGLTSITTTKTQASLSVPDYYKTIHAACQLQTGNMTQAQLFSLNAVLTDNKSANVASSSYANQLPGPNNGSAFAYIPLRDVPNIRPLPLIAYGTDCTIFERKYMQPCRLERLAVSLLDDKGNLVNLGDNNWSFALLVDEQIA
jgi:hypothetical protein